MLRTRLAVSLSTLLVFGAWSSARADDPSEYEQLRKELGNPVEAKKLDAIRKFKSMPADAAKAAELLAPLLTHNSPALRQAAATALGQIGPSAAPLVANSLKIANDRKHWPLAIDLLQKYEVAENRPNPEWLAVLAKHLEHSDAMVRRDTILALNKLGARTKEVVPAVAKVWADPDPIVRLQAGILLTANPAESIDALKPALKSPNSEHRLVAIQLLGKFDKHRAAAAPVVATLLKDPDVKVRIQVLTVLQAGAGEDVQPFAETLAGLLCEPDIQVRDKSKLLLAKIGPSAAPHVAALFKKAEHHKVWPIAVGLVEGFDAQDKKVAADWPSWLGAHLAHPDAAVRRETVDVLTKIGPRTKAVIPSLAKAIDDPDVVVRTKVHALLLLNGADAIAAIVPALKNEKAEQRLAAAQLLAKFDQHHAAVAPAMIPLLKDADARIRLVAANELLKGSGDAARPGAESLAGLLCDNDVQIRDKASKLLAKIGPGAAPQVSALLDNAAERKHWPVAIAILDKYDADEKKPGGAWMPAIAKHFQHDDVLVRRDAIDIVHRSIPRARPIVPDLAKLATDSDPHVRTFAANVLVAHPDVAVEALTKSLKDLKSPDERLLVAQLLFRFDKHRKEIAPALIPLLKDDDVRIKLQVLNSVMQARTPEMVVPVSEALRDPNVQVRHLSINFLVHSGKDAKAATANLAWALRDTDGHVRGNASNLLQSFGAESMPALMTALKGDNLQAQIAAMNIANSFGPFPQDTMPILAKLSRSDDANLRQTSLNALARQLPESASILKERLGDKNSEVRLAAANAMHNSWGDSIVALPELLVALRDSDPRVVNSAMVVASRIGGPAVPDLLKALKDPATRDVAIRVFEQISNDKNNLLAPLTEAARAGEPVAVRALRRVGPPAQPLLVELMASKNADVQEMALDSLAAMGGPTPATMPELKNLLKDSRPAIRSAALRYYVRWNPRKGDIGEYVETLLTFVGDKDWDVRRTATSYLARVGPVGPLSELAKKGSSVEVRTEALVALGFMGGRARVALPALIHVVRDPGEPHLRRRALWAIARVDPEFDPVAAGLVNDADSSVRAEGLALLKPRHVAAHRTVLAKLLVDRNEFVRQAAARALTHADAAIVAEVDPLLADANPEIRAAAVSVIGKHETPANLAKFLRDGSSIVRDAASVALAKQGESSYKVLREAFEAKNFRVERAAAAAAMQMEERPDDLIPDLIQAILSKEAEEPESLARAVLRINPVYGARRLAAVAEPAAIVELLQSTSAEVQELACRALEQKRPIAPAAADAVGNLLKDPKTPVATLAAAVRALEKPATSDVIDRIVRGTREQSKTLRDEAIAEMVGIDTSIESIETILAMFHLNQSIVEINEGVNLYSNSSSNAGVDEISLVRLFALAIGPNKVAPERLVPENEEALKAHFWRYVRVGAPDRNPKAGVSVDTLAWMSSAYVALGILKDDPAYKDRTWANRTAAQHYQEWTTWWQEFLLARASQGAGSGDATPQAAIWTCLLNLADFAGDAVVKDRAKMLLDVMAINEEQASLHGLRAGRSGRKASLGDPFDSVKDVYFGQRARTSDGVKNRIVFWTSNYQMPTAAILLRTLNRPEPQAAIVNHLNLGGSQTAFVAPNFALASAVAAPHGSMEPHGQWQRLVFDDGNAIYFPLVDGERRHVQVKNAYVANFVSHEQPAVELTADLKLVEKNGWIFVSNGPAHAALYFADGYRLVKNDERTRTRHVVHLVYPETPQTTIVLQAGDERAYASFEAFQTAILNASLVKTPQLLKYTGPGLPEIEFSRQANVPPLVGGKAEPLRSETKALDSPYLQANVGDGVVTTRFGAYVATYDFGKSRVIEPK